MHANLQTACETIRTAISVPDVPLAAIRRGAQARSGDHRQRRLRFVQALLACVALAGVAAAAAVLGHTHITFNPSGAMQLATDHGSAISDPTEAQLRAAVKAADFRAVLPTGLPENVKPKFLVRAGSSALLLRYDLPGAWRRSDHLLWIAIANPAALTQTQHMLSHNQIVLHPGGHAGRGSVRWHIGGEDVIVLDSTLTPAELENIHRAMLAAGGK